MIIGLNGYARAGKDTTAEVMKEFGFQRVAFADKLKEALYQLNPLVMDNGSVVPSTLGTASRLQRVIDVTGWDGYKQTGYSDEIRSLLQRMGTEVGRKTLWENIWVDAAISNLFHNADYVFTDVRFPNEAHAIKEHGGQVWNISRVGVGPANNHVSEVALDDWPFDKFIVNAGTLEEYKRYLRGVLREEFARQPS
jgi:hypothetical protein